MTTKKNTETAAEKVGDLKEEVADEAAREIAKEAVKADIAMDTGTKAPDPDPEDDKRQWHGWDEIQQYAYLVEGSFDQFEKAIDKKHGIPEEKVYGLLALERNGQNRTEWVKAAMKRLDLKADELPGGGPDYTNDTTNLSKL